MNCGFEIQNSSEMEFSFRDNATTTTSRTPIYQRTKHFHDFVNNYQGKLTKSINPEIIEQLRECFKRNVIETNKPGYTEKYTYIIV